MTTLNYNNGRTNAAGAAFSIPSILAAICAVATFIVDGPGTRLLVAVLAALFGVIGVVISLLPGKRGGLISTASIVIGAIALLVAIIQAINGVAT